MKKTKTSEPNGHPRTLVLGIGNVLMGDEGVGVAVIRKLETMSPLPSHVRLLDGGTGSFSLLGEMQEADRVILVDATVDGTPPGTWYCLKPRFASDYPPTLTAHDIGLKDLLDAFYLTGNRPDTWLYAISIGQPIELGLDLSHAIRQVVPEIAAHILESIRKNDIVHQMRQDTFN